jgi:hypothetical protein
MGLRDSRIIQIDIPAGTSDHVIMMIMMMMMIVCGDDDDAIEKHQ